MAIMLASIPMHTHDICKSMTLVWHPQLFAMLSTFKVSGLKDYNTIIGSPGRRLALQQVYQLSIDMRCGKHPGSPVMTLEGSI